MTRYDLYKHISTILTKKNTNELFDYIIHSMDDNGGFLRSRYYYSDSTLPDMECNEEQKIILVSLWTPFDFNCTTNYYDGKETLLKMQLFYEIFNEEEFIKTLKWSAAVGFEYPIRVDLENKRYEVLPVYIMGKPYIGYPRYKYGDFVRFSQDKVNGKLEEFGGVIEVVDAFGTLERKDEPSYDIMTILEAQKTLHKHVIESEIHFEKPVRDVPKRSLAKYVDRIKDDKD